MTASALRCGPETGKRSGHFPPPRTSSASIGSRSTCDGIHFPKPATNFSRGRDSFTSMSTMRVSNSKRHAHEQNSTGDSPNELRQASTPPDGLLVRDPGRRELVEHRCSNTEEALELFRPDFITRSQGRVRRLEQRARRRRALQGSNPDLLQGLREDPGKPRRNCTTPHPLSDNLFKPRERSISGREMQLRSRRIYNKLPEVTKKKEEEKKKTESQTNRLRAEVFKKKLLDQILQR
uniref:(E2-independent) E3 ubiquitin-conjugating enzyme FATS-like isoform X3 n=1 Tax=Solea senegalensis TaxID=28829 RepID=UPI001CD82F4C|nr:(E2-independent) E3 ubiquitin-conjugating enzyme FATS-like isoform X3 [Solea senegalensis]